MAEIDVDALRRALREELGAHRFRALVCDSHAPRFKWWQEKAWARFVEEHPEFRCDMDALRTILRWCPLHDAPLHRGEAERRHGGMHVMHVAHDWHIEAYRAFPYANSRSIATHDRELDGTTIEVWFCAACREAEAVWLDQHRGCAIPTSWLTHAVEARTTEALARDDLRSMELPATEIEALIARGRPAFAEGRLAQFLAGLRPGDELWRFKSPVATWASFSGRAGYGLVRDGRCIDIIVTLRN